MNSSPLAASLATRAALKDQLLRSFPELSDDEQALVDSLDGLSDLDEQIVRVLRAAIEREAHAEAIETMISVMTGRKRRLAEGAQKMRAAVLWAMQEAGLKTLSFPDMGVSVGRAKATVVITDAAALPDYCFRLKIEPDKIRIGKELAAGRAVEGAMLGNPIATLTVRRK